MERLNGDRRIIGAIMVERAGKLFRDPALQFEDCVRKIVDEFQCPTGIAEECVGFVVDVLSAHAARA
jgi:hypothetical protein